MLDIISFPRELSGEIKIHLDSNGVRNGAILTVAQGGDVIALKPAEVVALMTFLNNHAVHIVGKKGL